jgi:fructokinase
MLGGVELGGTKVMCLAGTGPDDVRAESRVATTDPEATLAAVVEFFAANPVEALGIASFGPVELRPRHPAWGRIRRTPKPGWEGADVAGVLGRGLGVPVAFDTDVNGAALGEGRWGAARGCRSFLYLTVGTGVGGGAVVDGRPVTGLVHPEMGHIAVPRLPGDTFPGVCPFHGDCLEGLTAGPALAARYGVRLEDADDAVRMEAAELAGAYLASGLRSLVYALAPERVVLGGGVIALPGLLSFVRDGLRHELAGYPGLTEHEGESFVASPALGPRAGVLGALLLAEQAQSDAVGAVGSVDATSI